MSSKKKTHTFELHESQKASEHKIYPPEKTQTDSCLVFILVCVLGFLCAFVIFSVLFKFLLFLFSVSVSVLSYYLNLIKLHLHLCMFADTWQKYVFEIQSKSNFCK